MLDEGDLKMSEVDLMERIFCQIIHYNCKNHYGNKKYSEAPDLFKYKRYIFTEPLSFSGSDSEVYFNNNVSMNEDLDDSYISLPIRSRQDWLREAFP